MATSPVVTSKRLLNFVL